MAGEVSWSEETLPLLVFDQHTRLFELLIYSRPALRNSTGQRPECYKALALVFRNAGRRTASPDILHCRQPFRLHATKALLVAETLTFCLTKLARKVFLY